MNDELDETNPGNRPPPMLSAPEFSALMRQVLDEHDAKMEKRLAGIESALKTIADQLSVLTEEKRAAEAWRERTDRRLSDLEAWRERMEQGASE